jgi:FixJ family two-component response regulator
MPNVDGLELQRRLKRQRPELPIIFMAAHHDDGEIERHVVEDGAVGFLRKSFTGSEFLRAIRHALGDPSARKRPLARKRLRSSGSIGPMLR